VLYTFIVYNTHTVNRDLTFIDGLIASGVEVFETGDASERLGLSSQATSNLLTRLVRQGLVDRVARGRFAIRPLGSLGTRAASEDVALAIGATFQDRPHRIAFRSALDHHGLLVYPAREIVVATNRSTSLSTISGRPTRIVIETSERLGTHAVDAGHGARVSSVERALLESAARPRLAGGIDAVASALSLADIDPHTLMQVAHDLGGRAGLHRLGSLAAVLEIDGLASALRPLTTGGRVIPLDPEYTDDGSPRAWRDEEWDVDWPYSVSELAAAARS
jgi:predicted transcriptional regulator of viral defense system